MRRLAAIVGRTFAGLAALCLTAANPLGAAADEPAPEFPAAAIEFFENSVRPILVARCHECHGAGESPEAGLRLMSRQAVLRGGETGPAAVSGEPNRSLLVEAVRYLDALQMPPAEKLSDGEIAALTKWVELGLPWPTEGSPEPVPAKPQTDGFEITPEQRQHWAFQAVGNPPPPAVRQTSWPSNAVDRFVLSALESRGLAPADRAQRRTLIRRLYFDLTGLPPAPEDAEEFIADEAPEAYAKLVDRLLASPAHGERWGRHWLDVVRYADSKDVRDIGQPYDIVESYRYRDWVVRALNQDLPFDDFLTHQVAGDLLPPTEPGGVNADGVIASSMLTIGCWGPGDADTQKMHTDMVDDQINVVSRAFMALTVGCARCHDHKFDPISTADYYGLAGIFFSTQIAIPQISAPYNKVPLATAAQIEAVGAHAARVAELEKNVKDYSDAQFAALPQTFLPQTVRYLLAAHDYQQRGPEQSRQTPAEFAAALNLRGDFLGQWIEYLTPAVSSEKLMQTEVRDIAGAVGTVGYRGEANEPIVVANPTDKPVSIPGTIAPGAVAVHPGPRSGVAVAWKSPFDAGVQIAGHVIDVHAACGDGVDYRLEHHRAGHVSRLAEGIIPNGGRQELALKSEDSPATVDVQTGDQIRLVVLPHGEYTCDMTEVELKISTVVADGVQPRHWSLADDVAPDLLDGGKGNPHRDRYGAGDVWRFLDLVAPAASRRAEQGPDSALAGWLQAVELARRGQFPRAQLQHVADSVQQALNQIQASPDGSPSPARRLADDLAAADGPFRIKDRDASLLPAEARARLSQYHDELTQLKAAAPKPIEYAMGAKEGGVPGTKYEGFHDAQIHIRGRYDRLGPTVPRRFPLILTGQEQAKIDQESGRLPLARWLASRENPLTTRVIVNRVWQHHFGQGIVRTPGNFGLKGDPPSHPELLDWLASRLVDDGWSLKRLHRLLVGSATYQQASVGTDDAMAADPDNRWFGRMPVRRLEAEAVRDAILAGVDGLDRSVAGPPLRKPGEDALSPRRAIYLMTNRSDKSGLRFLFDAADPEDIVDRRSVSTVAPQALLMLNGEFLLAQAPKFVERLFREAPTDDAQRIDRAYRLLYGRGATVEEQSLGQEFLHSLALKSAGASDAAKDEPLRLAWQAYAQTLLCTNEVVYVE